MTDSSPASQYPLHGGRFTVSGVLVLDDHRFEAVHATPAGSDALVLYFIADDDADVLVKVVDGRDINGYWWVQIAAVAQLPLEITVTETATGTANTYVSAEGPFTPVMDFEAIAGRE